MTEQTRETLDHVTRYRKAGLVVTRSNGERYFKADGSQEWVKDEDPELTQLKEQLETEAIAYKGCDHDRNQLRARVAVLEAALEPFTERGRDLDRTMCHEGLTTAEECCRCSKVIAARAALKDTGLAVPIKEEPSHGHG